MPHCDDPIIFLNDIRKEHLATAATSQDWQLSVPSPSILNRQHPDVVAATREMAARLQAVWQLLLQREESLLQALASGKRARHTGQQQSHAAQQLRNENMRHDIRLQGLSDIFAALEEVGAWLLGALQEIACYCWR